MCTIVQIWCINRTDHIAIVKSGDLRMADERAIFPGFPRSIEVCSDSRLEVHSHKRVTQILVSEWNVTELINNELIIN
jgi:hypothetical protein